MKHKYSSCSGCSESSSCSNCSGCKKCIENFSYETPKNMCHYSCASINTTNVILCLLIITLIYLLAKQNILSKRK